jgi:flagella basal body P-ring formation protein FlgA
MKYLPILWALLAPLAFACQAVEGEHITGRDLAAASPVFAALDPRLEIAATPLPGVPRLFHAVELALLAEAHGVITPDHDTANTAAPIAEICFERATEPLTAEKLLPVLRNALALDDASIVIEDFSRAGVPKGTLEFTRAGLSPVGLWRGQAVYAQARSVPVWVKVQVSVERTWIEAAEPLPAGKPIARTQLIERKGPRFPFGPMPLDSIDSAAGREPIRTIKAGGPIFASILIPPRAVSRGDQIHVIVESGETRIEFQAEAETSGRLGELVLVRNPDNGHHFQARVEGKDEVLIKR